MGNVVTAMVEATGPRPRVGAHFEGNCDQSLDQVCDGGWGGGGKEARLLIACTRTRYRTAHMGHDVVNDACMCMDTMNECGTRVQPYVGSAGGRINSSPFERWALSWTFRCVCNRNRRVLSPRPNSDNLLTKIQRIVTFGAGACPMPSYILVLCRCAGLHVVTRTTTCNSMRPETVADYVHVIMSVSSL